MQYSKQAVLNYVNGLDTEGYNTEELENDKNFMLEVISFSRDPKLFYLCSDSLQSDYEFVKSVIELFPDKISVVTDIAKSYLSKTPKEDITYKELVVVMNNLSDGKRSEVSEFNILALTMYLDDTLKYQVIKEKHGHEDWAKGIGKGFMLVDSDYENSDIIREYYARKFIDEIFYTRRVNFEEFIHTQAKSYSDIEEKGVVSFIAGIIGMEDQFLADYVLVHTSILDKVMKDLIRVRTNWDKYTTELDIRRGDIFFQEMQNYFRENELGTMTELDMSEFIARKYGLLDQFKRNGIINENDKVPFDSSRFDESKMTLQEIKALRHFSKLAKDLYKVDAIDDKPDDYDIPKNVQTQIINIM